MSDDAIRNRRQRARNDPRQDPRQNARQSAEHDAAGAPAVLSRLQKAWGRSPFYQSRLHGPAPDRFYCQVKDPTPHDRAVADAILAGRFAAPPDEIDCLTEGVADPASVFDAVGPGRPLFAYIHGWRWLADLSPLGADAPAAARALAAAWCDRYEDWSPPEWRAPQVGERLIALCRHGEILLQGGDAVWRSRLLATVARQTRHLAYAGHKTPGAYDRLTAALALTLIGLCLPGCEEPMERGLELLRREARLQFRSDGGHLSRNPSRQLEIVLRLRQTLEAFERRSVAPPSFLRHLTARAADHLAIFRLGDGRLAVFNGGYEETAAAVDAAIGAPDEESLIGFARYSGYQRLNSGRSVLAVEVGAPDLDDAGGRSRRGFDGVGSFHLAAGRERLIVNCGAGARLSPEWDLALRQASAHSALSFEPVPGLAAEFGPAAHRRAENDQGQLIEIDRRFRFPDRARDDRRAGDLAAQAGHMRRLFLRHGGEELLGEDILIEPSPAQAAAWRIRFHLAPGVRASIARDGRSALVLLPGGEGWRFKSNWRAMTLERSVYCGAGGAPQSTEQIVLAGQRLEAQPRGDMVVKWGWRRVAA
ncbi:MAG: hypothetical protein GC152_10400 [Alphaproteobacteria bacterium]|nr:hypothetical protein [Alphaproteobacteria bacterium]